MSADEEAPPPAATSAEVTAAHLSRLELFAVLLMALTAVLTAWSAFEASKWGGIMSIDFSAANAARTESVRSSDLANRQVAVDVELFSTFVDAYFAGDEAEVVFFRQRFPDRLAVAVDAWIATDPINVADAPGTPFEMEEYVVEASEEADRLQRQADGKSEDARRANQTGDNYTITSVAFATVILLAALSSKVRMLRTARLLIGLSVVVFAASMIIIATYPIEI